jgi:hypothetical protein
MYHLRMDIGSGNVLVRMDFISFYPLDQSGASWWTYWILGIGDVCLFVCPLFLYYGLRLTVDSIMLLIHIFGLRLQP